MSVLLAATLAGSAFAQSPSVPRRQIPPSVLAEVQLLENRFDVALAADCAPERCYPKGCVYVDHATADRPRSSSLPGLGAEMGPSPEDAQQYLTRARCAFTHEKNVNGTAASSLVRRLESKLSRGWLVVTVEPEPLPPVSRALQEAIEPEPEAPVEAPPPDPPADVEEEEPDWLRELWVTLLPHFAWMIAVALFTLATTLLIWAYRRVGQASIEEQMLLAQIQNGGAGEDEPEAAVEAAPAEPAVSDEDFVAERRAAWTERLDAMDPDAPEAELQALVRALLRSGDLPLLAKAVLELPKLPAAFPRGGEIASAKLELAEYLKRVDASELPADAAFYAALDRHALSATLASQSDAEIVRSLREEFGAAGLVDLIGRLPARAGALLFALAPLTEQREMVRLLNPHQVAKLCEQLLRSNRMGEAETAYLFRVLTAVRDGAALPQPPAEDVSDRGPETEAAAALSVLLPRLSEATRGQVFASALERFNGTLPAWYRGILFPGMLAEMGDEARNDLLLGLDVERLAAWVSLLDPGDRAELLQAAPDALRRSIKAASVFSSPGQQVALAELARRDLARGYQEQLARANTALETVLGGTTAS
ncbi:MAG: hypothetical protein H6736_18835 [Alphaproteobacteria bacterium]|nr:hypothetical protein [Alphaproteobacteria bacterium]